MKNKSSVSCLNCLAPSAVNTEKNQKKNILSITEKASSSDVPKKNDQESVCHPNSLIVSAKTSDKKMKKRVIGKNKSFKSSLQPKQNENLNYNPSTYAQNFDDDSKNDDPDYPSFSSRYAASSKNKRTNSK